MASDPLETNVASQIHHIQKLMARISTQYQKGALKSHALESAYEDLDEARRALAGILSHQEEKAAGHRLHGDAHDHFRP
ncbi:MAG TPA: hypothetical protein VNZ52_14080 [Candidatus Thermoplasmatota archaeon]|nr:hypothetical protein [Candidatus Thermoplasmatota archaeon]